ncbi:MAG: hypothetical protein AMS25_14760 [Gemmatimonas sp. SM23_52]|nr:MAG: hypothetical protein AMS25_14760 [Gemmatimonas sp. SM23_52]
MGGSATAEGPARFAAVARVLVALPLGFAAPALLDLADAVLFALAPVGVFRLAFVAFFTIGLAARFLTGFLTAFPRAAGLRLANWVPPPGRQDVRNAVDYHIIAVDASHHGGFATIP